MPRGQGPPLLGATSCESYPGPVSSRLTSAPCGLELLPPRLISTLSEII